MNHPRRDTDNHPGKGTVVLTVLTGAGMSRTRRGDRINPTPRATPWRRGAGLPVTAAAAAIAPREVGRRMNQPERSHA